MRLAPLLRALATTPTSNDNVANAVPENIYFYRVDGRMTGPIDALKHDYAALAHINTALSQTRFSMPRAPPSRYVPRRRGRRHAPDGDRTCRSRPRQTRFRGRYCLEYVGPPSFLASTRRPISVTRTFVKCYAIAAAGACFKFTAQSTKLSVTCSRAVADTIMS